MGIDGIEEGPGTGCMEGIEEGPGTGWIEGIKEGPRPGIGWEFDVESVEVDNKHELVMR